MTGFRGHYRTPPRRYVNNAEMAEQAGARAELNRLAVEASNPPEAMPASSMSPFLRYHAHCPRVVCRLAEREGEQLGARMLVILNAAYAVQSARGR